MGDARHCMYVCVMDEVLFAHPVRQTQDVVGMLISFSGHSWNLGETRKRTRFNLRLSHNSCFIASG